MRLGLGGGRRSTGFKWWRRGTGEAVIGEGGGAAVNASSEVEGAVALDAVADRDYADLRRCNC